MPIDPSQVRAAYYVTGVTGYGELCDSLDDALAVADATNQQPGNIAESGLGRAFVVPVMTIAYPLPAPEIPPVDLGLPTV